MKSPANPMCAQSCLYLERLVFSDCFCQVQPCQAAAKVLMHVTIEPLQQYHKSLKLRVGIYHLSSKGSFLAHTPVQWPV